MYLGFNPQEREQISELYRRMIDNLNAIVVKEHES